MTRRKNSPSVPGEQIAKQILNNYDLKNAQDVQEVMKQIFGPIFESMLKAIWKIISAAKSTAALKAAPILATASVNASFRKVTKKGSFPNEDAVFKIFYLRITELYQKWGMRKVANWAMVRNQLFIDDRMADLMAKYDRDF